MSPEIEKLIDFALADGVISDKEREIIRNKAEKLGEDPDEVDMILDAKLAMKGNQAATPPPAASSPPPINTAPAPPPAGPPPAQKKSAKVGNTPTCPTCGATVKSFTSNCKECGHEFRNVGVTTSIDDLFKELKTVKKSRFKDEDGDTDEDEYNIARAEVIKNFTIPTAKEDLIEFATKSIGKYNPQEIDDDTLNSAWEGIATEALLKLELFAMEDPSLKEYCKKLDAKLKGKLSLNKKKKSSRYLAIVSGMFFCYLLYSWIAALFGYHFWPF
jgi:hypothetical protein